MNTIYIKVIYFRFKLLCSKFLGAVPIFISMFLAYIAYGQYNISKQQNIINKQQTEIARITVALNMRDKKYDVFKRWIETYNKYIDDIYKNVAPIDFQRPAVVMSAMNDELHFNFDQNDKIKIYLAKVQDIGLDIVITKKSYACSQSIDTAEFDNDCLDVPYVTLNEYEYKQNIEKKVIKMNNYRQLLFEELYKELEVSNDMLRPLK